MRIDLFIIGLLTFTLVAFVLFTTFASNIANYSLTDADTSKFAETFSKLDQVHGSQQTVKDNVLGGEVADEGVEDTMFKGGYTGLKNIFGVVDLTSNLSQTIILDSGIADNSQTNLASWIIDNLMAILIVLFLFSILAYVFRFMPR